MTKPAPRNVARAINITVFIVLAALLVPTVIAGQQSQSVDPFEHVGFLIGRREGTSEGPGHAPRRAAITLLDGQCRTGHGKTLVVEHGPAEGRRRGLGCG